MPTVEADSRAKLSRQPIQRSGVVVSPGVDCLIVELLPMPGCVGCERQRRAGFGPGHCGLDLLGLAKASMRCVVEVAVADAAKNRHARPYQPGDTVQIEMPPPSADWLMLAFKVYMLPTAGLLTGATIGQSAGEPVAIVSAIAGLFTGLLIGRRTVHDQKIALKLSRSELCTLRIVNAVDDHRS